jgi:cellulose synthase/poly-beta-1,6-N-acetylglucosamine synthase-like glycosyltransferase
MFEVIIPARNEEHSLPNLLGAIRTTIPDARIVVVDNASEDRTGRLARSYGADEVIFESKVGKGYAVFAGVSHSITQRPFFCDADVVGLDWSNVPKLLNCEPKTGPVLQRLTLERTPEESPVTSLLARPLLEALEYSQITEPLGGLFCLDKQGLIGLHFPGGWGVDVSITIECLRKGVEIREIPCPGVSHRKKPLADYQSMANQVASAMAQSLGFVPWDHSDCALCCSNNQRSTGRKPEVAPKIS